MVLRYSNQTFDGVTGESTTDPSLHFPARNLGLYFLLELQTNLREEEKSLGFLLGLLLVESTYWRFHV